jgi:hypothetical protein
MSSRKKNAPRSSSDSLLRFSLPEKQGTKEDKKRALIDKEGKDTQEYEITLLGLFGGSFPGESTELSRL